MEPLKRIKRRLYPALARHTSHTALVEGPLKVCGVPFRCLLVDNGNFTEHLQARMYGDAPKLLRQGRIWNPLLARRVIAANPGFDLCVAVLPQGYGWLFNRLCTFEARPHVRQVIATDGPWDAIRSGFHRKKKELSGKLETKFGLDYRLSREASDLALYYHRMYLPLVRRQFGPLAVVESYEKILERFRRGFLLFVTQGGEPVAGALCTTADRTLKFHSGGVLDAADRYIKGGAQMALYYFQLRLAEAGEFDALDAGRSRPFLNDGVYRTKREWGAAARPDDDNEPHVFLFAPRLSEALAHFFVENPTIVCSEQGLKAVVGFTGEVNDEAKTRLTRQFGAPGLAGLCLVSAGSAAPLDLPFPRPGVHTHAAIDQPTPPVGYSAN